MSDTENTNPTEHTMDTNTTITTGTRLSYEDAANPRKYATVTEAHGAHLMIEWENGDKELKRRSQVEASIERGSTLAGWRNWGIPRNAPEAPAAPEFKITIKWSENENLTFLGVDQGCGFEYPSFAAFTAQITAFAASYPDSGCCDKTAFAIHHLQSGDVYDGRLDLQHPSRETADNDLLRHVRQACTMIVEADRYSADDKACASAWAARFENAQ